MALSSEDLRPELPVTFVCLFFLSDEEDTPQWTAAS
jgi:hypothetical protein